MVSFLTEEQHNKSDVQGKLFRGWKVGCNGGGVQQKIEAKADHSHCGQIWGEAANKEKPFTLHYCWYIGTSQNTHQTP